MFHPRVKSSLPAKLGTAPDGREGVTQELSGSTPRSSIMADGHEVAPWMSTTSRGLQRGEREHVIDKGPACDFFNGGATGGKAPTGDAGRGSSGIPAIGDVDKLGRRASAALGSLGGRVGVWAGPSSATTVILAGV